MDDEQLLALKKNGGVIQIVAFARYVKTDSPERQQALDALAKEFGLPPGTPLGGAAAAEAGAGAGRRRGAGGSRSGGAGAAAAAAGAAADAAARWRS